MICGKLDVVVPFRALCPFGATTIDLPLRIQFADNEDHDIADLGIGKLLLLLLTMEGVEVLDAVFL